MFKRLLLEDYTAACLTVAFATAATIFLAFTWRALRMSRAQVERFEQLPFASESRPEGGVAATVAQNPESRRA